LARGAVNISALLMSRSQFAFILSFRIMFRASTLGMVTRRAFLEVCSLIFERPVVRGCSTSGCGSSSSPSTLAWSQGSSRHLIRHKLERIIAAHRTDPRPAALL
jgi:hypothetical protein